MLKNLKRRTKYALQMFYRKALKSFWTQNQGNQKNTWRTLAACDEALNNLSDEELLQKLEKNFSQYSSKLKRQESELNSFCKRTGLLPDGSRQQAYGFGRSTAQKAVWRNKKAVAKSAEKSIIKSIDIDDFEVVTYGKILTLKWVRL